MDAQTFLKNFETIAEAPGGTQRLRSLVLDLAVRGRLTDSMPGESTATPASASPLSRGNHESNYPLRWPVFRLADVAEVRLGRQRSPTKATGDRMRPYLRAANVGWTGLRLDDVKEMAFTEQESLAYELRAGDLLLSEASGSPTEVGKPAQYRGEIPGCCFQNTLIRVRLRNGLSPDFYELYFKQQARSGRFASSSRGVGINHLGARTLSEWSVPVPPVAEQERILERVEELTRLCDELEAQQERHRFATARFRGSALHALIDADTSDGLLVAWERVSTHWTSLADNADSVDAMHQAILCLATRGRLVKQHTTDSPANHLIQQLAEKRGRPESPLPVEPRSELPDGWTWASFGEATINRDAERVPVKRADRERRRGQYDYYGASGVIDTIDDFIYDGELLLVGEDGANLVMRSTPIAFLARGRFWVNNHAHVLDSADPASLRYLAMYVNSIDLQPYLTGIAQPKLNQARLNKIPVPLPPLEEQRRIVERVEELQSTCERLKESLSTRADEQLAVSTALTRLA